MSLMLLFTIALEGLQMSIVLYDSCNFCGSGELMTFSFFNMISTLFFIKPLKFLTILGS